MSSSEQFDDSDSFQRMPDDTERRIEGIISRTMADLYANAGVPMKPFQEMTPAEIASLREAAEAIKWDFGYVEWIHDVDIADMTPHQRSMQEELQNTAVTLVDPRIDIDLTRGLSLLRYIIDHPDTQIAPLWSLPGYDGEFLFDFPFSPPDPGKMQLPEEGL